MKKLALLLLAALLALGVASASVVNAAPVPSPTQQSTATPTAGATPQTEQQAAAAAAICQGSIGCDSGWKGSTYYEPSSGKNFNQNIEVIWYTSNIHRIYLSGSTSFPPPEPPANEGHSYMQIYYRVHPSGSWVLRETVRPGPAYGSYTNRQYAGWPDRSARDWVVKGCSFGSCFNTPVVYN